MTDQLDVMLSDDSLGPEVKVGTLFRTVGRGGETSRFEYAPAWLDRSEPPACFAIDPELPLFAGPHHTDGHAQLQGIFRDASPDRWGRILMERREALEAKDEARPARSLREWDFLAGVSDQTRMGALRLWDPSSRCYVDNRELGAPPVTSLRELEDVVARLDQPGVEDRSEYRQWLRQLIVPGTSLGGARPKATYTQQDGSIWMAKFPASEDRQDVGLWEFLTHRLATRAGIDMPVADRFRFSNRGHTFAVRRFDREGSSRRLYASAMSLLLRVDGDTGSYLEIAELIEQAGDPSGIRLDLAQLYRRILFSILVGNRDDHFRNHGFLRSPGGWRLSPAFDINPNPERSEHTLCIDETDPSPLSESLVATKDYYRLNSIQASTIESEVRAVVNTWEAEAKAIGVSGGEIAILRGVIDPAR